MIRKLEWSWTLDDKTIVNKINELVCAVGKLETMAKNTNTVLESLVKESNIHEKQIDELQMKVEPEKCKIPVGPYKEQRNWIGKLCWFWDNEYGLKTTVGVLEEISTIGGEFPYLKKESHTVWKHCEPVKPEDEIIYKGDEQ